MDGMGLDEVLDRRTDRQATDRMIEVSELFELKPQMTVNGSTFFLFLEVQIKIGGKLNTRFISDSSAPCELRKRPSGGAFRLCSALITLSL